MAIVVTSLITVDSLPDVDTASLTDATLSEKQRITRHLQLVCDILQLTASQHSARLAALEALQQYIRQGRYPAARFTGVEQLTDSPQQLLRSTGRLRVFIDRATDVHCAVGHLMATTGCSQLAADIDSMAHTTYIHRLQQMHDALAASPAMALITMHQQQLSPSGSAPLPHAQQLAWIQPDYHSVGADGNEVIDDSHVVNVDETSSIPYNPQATATDIHFLVLGFDGLVVLYVFQLWVNRPTVHSSVLAKQYELHLKFQHVVSMLFITFLYTTATTHCALPAAHHYRLHTSPAFCACTRRQLCSMLSHRWAT